MDSAHNQALSLLYGINSLSSERAFCYRISNALTYSRLDGRGDLTVFIMDNRPDVLFVAHFFGGIHGLGLGMKCRQWLDCPSSLIAQPESMGTTWILS